MATAMNIGVIGNILTQVKITTFDEVIDGIKSMIGDDGTCDVHAVIKYIEDSRSTLQANGAKNIEKMYTNKRGKQIKRPRKPTAYNLFVRDKMIEIKKQDPSLRRPEYMKRAIKAWNELKSGSLETDL